MRQQAEHKIGLMQPQKHQYSDNTVGNICAAIFDFILHMPIWALAEQVKNKKGAI